MGGYGGGPSISAMMGGGGGSESGRDFDAPPKGSKADKIKSFFTRFFDHKSPFRQAFYDDCALYKFFHESVHWLDIPKGTSNPEQALRITRQDPDEADTPQVVQNECLAIIDNEIAKLGKRQGKARVRATADSARTGGAKRAGQILDWHLEEQVRWPPKRRKGITHNVLYGIGIWKSYWETNYLDTVPLGVTGAVRCLNPECGEGGSIFSSTSVPPELTEVDPTRISTSRSITDTGSIKESMSMTSCLVCGSGFEPHTILPNEVSGTDALGRPLLNPVPIGSPQIEVVQPQEFFVQNEGIGVEPWDCGEWGQDTPRPLEWVAKFYDIRVTEDGRYFTKDGEELKPESPELIAREHPIMGETPYTSVGFKGVSGRQNLYRGYVRLREYYKAPTRRYPLGRAMVMAGNVVIMDDDLMIKSKTQKGTLYPRVKFCVARFWPKDGEFFWQSILTPLISPQNNINMAFSQVTDSRERYGTDVPLLTPGMRLVGSGWLTNSTGTAAVIQPDPEFPQYWPPTTIPARMIDSRIYQEIDRKRDFMLQCVGAQDADIGKAPRNVRAATAIQLLLSQAAERRDAREQELRDAHKELFSHQMLLLAEKVIEPRAYKVPNENNSYEMGEFIGTDLAGHTDIVVEEEASYDQKAFEREALMEAFQQKLLTAATPYSQREARKAIGVITTIADEENVQIDDAERKWFAFRDNRKVPPVDPTEDDHPIHWQAYGRFLKSTDGIRLKEEAGWELVLQIIPGWEERLAMAEAMDMQARQLQAQSEQVGLPVDPQILMMLLPAALPARILRVWTTMAALQQVQLPQHPLINFKATHEAHRIYAERAAMKAMMGVPGQPAPGAGPAAGAPPGGEGAGAPPPGAEPSGAEGVVA